MTVDTAKRKEIICFSAEGGAEIYLERSSQKTLFEEIGFADVEGPGGADRSSLLFFVFFIFRALGSRYQLFRLPKSGRLTLRFLKSGNLFFSNLRVCGGPKPEK